MTMKELIEQSRQKKLASRDVSKWNKCRQDALYHKCDNCNDGALHQMILCYDDYCHSYNSDKSCFPEVEVSAGDFVKCNRFAKAVGTGKYCEARSTSGISEETVIDNILTGKIGEFVVRNTLQAMGIACSDPDLQIYGVNDKSFDSDLRCVIDDAERDISVKTFAIKDGLPSRVSWMAQLSDINSSKSGTDKHFFNPNDSYRKGVMFAGVSLSPDRLHGRLLVFMPMQTLYDSDSYEMLESGKFKNTKKAVYFDTLESKELAGFIKTGHSMA